MNLEDLLKSLHEDVAQHLHERITSGDATAAEVRNAIQFLRDNGIQDVRKYGPTAALAEAVKLPYPTAAEVVDEL